MLRTSLTASVAMMVLVGPAWAAEYKPFDRAQFDAARAEGSPVLIDVAAPWCPVCHSQEATIKATVADPAYAKLTIFKIDFDTQAAIWKSFGATKQSTLIGYKGGHEVGRVVYQTDKTQINNLLKSTVQ